MAAQILVTGFEPFRDFVTNPSWQAVATLRERWGAAVVTAELPVDFVPAHERLRALLREVQPRVVLCTGVARGDVFRIETVARRPAALQALGSQELLGGHWPWLEMLAELQALELAVVQSQDAGQYVCESTYWSLLDFREQYGQPEFAAFLHVPSESEQHSIERIAAAISNVVRVRSAALGLLL
jgi:pyroglutamyl-peptidase